MTVTTKSTPARRGRPRKIESYAAWMARVDAEVDHMARSMERKPPTYAYLHPAQKRIIQMLIEYMRSLPELTAGENIWHKEYRRINIIILELFLAKYPEWARAPKTSQEHKDFAWMLRNCAGRAPAEVAARDIEDDD